MILKRQSVILPTNRVSAHEKSNCWPRMNCLFSVPRGPWFYRARVHNPPVDTGAITPPAPSCSLVFDTTFGWFLEWLVIAQPVGSIVMLLWLFSVTNSTGKRHVIIHGRHGTANQKKKSYTIIGLTKSRKDLQINTEKIGFENVTLSVRMYRKICNFRPVLFHAY